MNPYLLLGVAAYLYFRKKSPAPAPAPSLPYSPPSQAAAANQLAPSSDAPAMAPPSNVMPDPAIVPPVSSMTPAPEPIQVIPPGKQGGDYFPELPIRLPGAGNGFLKPIIAPIEPFYQPINLPSAPPPQSAFPAPSAIYPMPMLLWSAAKQAWVPSGSEPSSGTAMVLDPMSGKMIKVSGTHPYLAYIDNGTVKMSPNMLHELSIITRTKDGLIVY